MERACSGVFPPLPSRDWHALLLLVCPNLPVAVTEGAFLAAAFAEAAGSTSCATTRGGSGGQRQRDKGGLEGAGGGEAGVRAASGHDAKGKDAANIAVTLSFPALYPTLQIAILHHKFLDTVRAKVFAHADFTARNAEQCCAAIEGIWAESDGNVGGGGTASCLPGDIIRAAIAKGAYRPLLPGDSSTGSAAGAALSIGSPRQSGRSPCIGTAADADGSNGNVALSLPSSSLYLDQCVITYQRFLSALCCHHELRAAAAGELRDYGGCSSARLRLERSLARPT